MDPAVQGPQPIITMFLHLTDSFTLRYFDHVVHTHQGAYCTAPHSASGLLVGRTQLGGDALHGEATPRHYRVCIGKVSVLHLEYYGMCIRKVSVLNLEYYMMCIGKVSVLHLEYYRMCIGKCQYYTWSTTGCVSEKCQYYTWSSTGCVSEKCQYYTWSTT